MQPRASDKLLGAAKKLRIRSDNPGLPSAVACGAASSCSRGTASPRSIGKDVHKYADQIYSESSSKSCLPLRIPLQTLYYRIQFRVLWVASLNILPSIDLLEVLHRCNYNCRERQPAICKPAICNSSQLLSMFNSDRCF